MGFGFNILFLFFLIALPLIFTVICLASRQKKLIKFAGYFWILVFAAASTLYMVRSLKEKKKLGLGDIYGTYVVDKEKYKGKQADWQYDHFHFKITKDNHLFFYETENNKILKTIKVDIALLDYYNAPRLKLLKKSEDHHIIAENPTLYRTVWSFYYVFHSNKFGNIFFKKASWY